MKGANGAFCFGNRCPSLISQQCFRKRRIPLLVLPSVIFATIVATQLVMLLWTSVLLLMNGISPSTTWTHFNMFRQSLILAYGLIALVALACADLRLAAARLRLGEALNFSLGRIATLRHWHLRKDHF